MYLRLRGRDGDSTVVITYDRWVADFTFEVTWDAPSTRPVYEQYVSNPAMLSRVASPFVEIDDALYGYIVERSGSHPGWGRVFDRPETVTLRGRPRKLQQARYARGGVLLALSEPFPGRTLELTRWLPGLGLGPNQAAILVGASTRGALQALVAAGVVTDTGRVTWSGRTLFHVVDVSPLPDREAAVAVRHDYAECA